MCPKPNVQRVGGGVRARACNRKMWWPCMKHTVVFDLVRAVRNVFLSSLIPCDRYAQGCIKQSAGRLHGSLDVDDGKDVCARTWGFGAGVAADAAVGNAPGESGACRDLRTDALGPSVGNRGVDGPWAYRHCKAVAVGSRAQPVGVRMRWLAWAGASWALWCISEVSRLQPQRQ